MQGSQKIVFWWDRDWYLVCKVSTKDYSRRLGLLDESLLKILDMSKKSYWFQGNQWNFTSSTKHWQLEVNLESYQTVDQTA